MAIDASIYGQIQPVRQENPINTLAQVLQVRGLQSQMERADRAEQQQNRLLQLVGGSDFQKMDTTGKANALQGVGAFEQAGSLVKADAAASKDRREAEKFQIESALKKMDAMGQIMGNVNDQASYDIARQQAAQIFGPDAVANISPVYNPAEVSQRQMQALAVKEQLAQKWKSLEFGLDTQKFAETQRHNRTTEGTAQGNLAVNQQRLDLERNLPQGQVVQTDSGTMLVDRRTGEARPVTSNGQPVQKPGKEIPANVNKSIIDNQQSLNKIDRAIEAVTADPKALGLQYAIPGAETVGQYLDSSGVPTRAAVADIGSLVLHDRSGAAVTVSEFPRLKPFIPTASDSPKAAVEKLKQLRKAMADEADLLAQTYSKEQGYKESPVLKSQSSQKAAPTLKRKTIGGKTYENDGKGWYVVN